MSSRAARCAAARKFAMESFSRNAQFRCYLLPAAFVREGIPFFEPSGETVRHLGKDQIFDLSRAA